MKTIYLVVYYENLSDEELTFDNAYDNYQDALKRELELDYSDIISINLIEKNNDNFKSYL